MCIFKAIRISMSIPIIYNKIDYNSLIYVDGGVSNNYPIDYFEKNLEKTLGFLIMSESHNEPVIIEGIDTFMYYNLMILSSSIDHNKYLLYNKNTVKLSCTYSN